MPDVDWQKVAADLADLPDDPTLFVEWCDKHEAPRWLWEPDECMASALHRHALGFAPDPCEGVERSWVRLVPDPEEHT